MNAAKNDEVWDDDRELHRLVVVGSVDDGKSTLIGRLLYETGSLYEDQIAQARAASKQGDGELDYSLFTDGLRAEREQAITIDVAYRSFSLGKRRFILADTPGHVQYTRNMATGASTADVAIILIDARHGLSPQTRRHAFIASLLGIPTLAVAINKMDLVGFDREVFSRLSAQLAAFTRPLAFEELRFFPISARLGDNLVSRSAATPWYDGPTLLDFLSFGPLKPPPATEDAGRRAPFRFPVQLVLRPHLDYRALAGRVSSGAVRPGDEVVSLPSGRRSRVASIETADGPLARATSGMSVALRLADEIDTSRGELLAPASAPPRVTTQFEATLIWLAETPLDPDRPYLIKHTTRVVPVRVEQLDGRVSPETLALEPTDRLGLNDIGRVVLRTARPLMLDTYEQSRTTGSFIVIEPISNATAAAGLVLRTDIGGTEPVCEPGVEPVTVNQRVARLGQHGAIVLVDLTQQPELTSRTAAALERTLFDAGLKTAYVEGQAVGAIACASAGLVTVCAAAGDAHARERLRLELRVAGLPLHEVSTRSPAEMTRLAEELSDRATAVSP